MVSDEVLKALAAYLDEQHAAEDALRPFVDHDLAMTAQRVADVNEVFTKLREAQEHYADALVRAGFDRPRWTRQ